MRLREDIYDDHQSEDKLRGDLYQIEDEVESISSAEEQLMKKAKDLENEMRAIRSKKMEVVLK